MVVQHKDGTEDRVRFGKFYWWAFVAMASVIGVLLMMSYNGVTESIAAIDADLHGLENRVDTETTNNQLILLELKHINERLARLEKILESKR